MKKIIVFVVMIFIAIDLTGCDTVQRKFTRKKKYAKPIPKLYQIKKYDVEPSVELYRKHYAYWQSWMSELIQDLGQNSKRDLRSIDEALSQLHDMRNILVPDKAEQLDKHIKRLEDAREIIAKGALSQFNNSQVLSTIEREDRIIKSEFDAAKVKGYIKESFDEVPPVAAETPSPAAATFGASLPRAE